MLDEIEIENEGYKAGWNAALSAILEELYSKKVWVEADDSSDYRLDEIIDLANEMKK